MGCVEFAGFDRSNPLFGFATISCGHHSQAHQACGGDPAEFLELGPEVKHHSSGHLSFPTLIRDKTYKRTLIPKAAPLKLLELR